MHHKLIQVQSLQQIDADIPKLHMEDNVLKMQNISLATRLDYYKKTIKEQRAIMTELVERDIRHSSFFNFLEQTWRGFIQRNMRLSGMLRKQGKLEGKYINAFQYLDDIFHSQYAFSNNGDMSFKKQISHKFEQFLRLIENMYLEISIDYTQFMQMIQSRTQQLSEDSDYCEYVKTLITTNKEIIEKNQEIGNTFKQILTIKERKLNDIDGQIAFQSIFQLQQLLAETNKQNETLTRRLRLLYQYNDKSITQKLHEEDETFECVCGGSQIQAKLQHNPHYAELIKHTLQSEDSIKTKQTQLQQQPTQASSVNIPLISQLLQKALKNKDKKVVQHDQESYIITFNSTEIKDLETVLMNHFGLQQKNQILVQQNSKYQSQQVQLIKKQKELEVALQYREDKFIESETFKYLKTHNMSLVEQHSVLAFQVTQIQQQYQEVVYQKRNDLIQMQHYFEHEIQKLSQEIGFLQQKLNDRKIFDQYQIPQNDIEHFMTNLRERNLQLEKVVDAQMHEILSQRKLYRDLKSGYDELIKSRDEFSHKYQETEQRCQQLANKIPGEFNPEQLNFRHSKYKDIILEISNYLGKQGPQLRDKFNDLASYIKSRDSRVDHMDKEISKLKGTISEQKRHQELMLEDADLNSKTYDEAMAKSKLVEQQLKIKEKNEATLIQEKIAEKASSENEKNNLILKIRMQNDLIQRLNLQLSDEQQYQQSYMQGQELKQENYVQLLTEFEQNKLMFHQLQSDIMTIQIEKDSLQNKITHSSLINEESLLQIDQFTQKVLELEIQIQQLEQQINDPNYLLQSKGYLIVKQSSDVGEQNLQAKLKQTACCSECKIQLKEMILSKCMHMLCRDCAESAQKCPICKVQIHLTDIWPTKVQE